MAVSSSLTSMLVPDGVVVWAAPVDRQTVVRALIERVAPMLPRLTAADIARRIEERDALGSTFIGEGVDLPHARVDQVAAPVFAMGLTRGGLRAADGEPAPQPTDLVWLLVLPPGGSGLSATAQVARACRDATFRAALRAVQDTEAARHALSRWEFNHDPPTARWST
jgi:PTS system nitrogen regulatory IIA component